MFEPIPRACMEMYAMQDAERQRNDGDQRAADVQQKHDADQRNDEAFLDQRRFEVAMAR